MNDSKADNCGASGCYIGADRLKIGKQQFAPKCEEQQLIANWTSDTEKSEEAARTHRAVGAGRAPDREIETNKHLNRAKQPDFPTPSGSHTNENRVLPKRGYSAQHSKGE